MSCFRRRRGLVLGGWLLVGSWSVAEVGEEGFEDLMNRPPWASCTYCHGVNGAIDDPNVPALAGQSSAYLRKQIADFRSGNRTDASGMMTSALILLDPEDDVRVAEHFATQERPAPRIARRTAPVDRRAAGEQLFWNGSHDTPACADCHVSSAFDAPLLGGLNDSYVTRQLKRFRSGERANDAHGMMRSVAASMDDDQIASVARFIANP